MEMEKKKRYPLSMWDKLTRVTYMTNVIPMEHKEKFIDIVGTKVARYRNQGMHRRYKPEKLPKALYQDPELRLDDYNTILYKEDTTLVIILENIYNAMKNKWFGNQ